MPLFSCCFSAEPPKVQASVPVSSKPQLNSSAAQIQLTENDIGILEKAELEECTLTRVTDLLKVLASVRHPNPLECLNAASELVVQHLGCSLFSVAVITELGAVPAWANVTAAGVDADHALIGTPYVCYSNGLCSTGNRTTPTSQLAESSVQRVQRMQECIRGSVTGSSTASVLMQPGGKRSSSAFSLSADAASGELPLPVDWLALNKACGLCHFAAAPIVAQGRLLGVVTAADSDSFVMQQPGLMGQLEAAATWMSQWLLGGEVARLVQLLTDMSVCGDLELLVRTLCLGLQEVFKARCDLKLHARLALLSSSSSALMFEEERPRRSQHNQEWEDPLGSLNINTGHVTAGSAPSASQLLSAVGGGPTGTPYSPRAKSQAQSELTAKLKAIRNSTAMSSLEDLKLLTNALTASTNTVSSQLATAIVQQQQQQSAFAGASGSPFSRYSLNDGIAPTGGSLGGSPMKSFLAASLNTERSHQGGSVHFSSSSVGVSLGLPFRNLPLHERAVAAVASEGPVSPTSVAPRSGPAIHGGGSGSGHGTATPPHSPAVSAYGGTRGVGSSSIPFRKRAASSKDAPYGPSGASGQQQHTSGSSAAAGSGSGFYGDRSNGPERVQARIGSCSSVPANMHLLATGGPGGASGPYGVGFSPSRGLVRRPSNVSEIAGEDVLLRMVQEVEDEAVPGRFAVHCMPLEKTILAQAAAQPPGARGTWIADVATYMMQPNRPGRDIVISPLSYPVASLVLSCMTAPGSDALEPTVAAVYLTSPVTVAAMTLQSLLRDLGICLSLVSNLLLARLDGALREQWAALMVQNTGQGPPSLSPASRAHSLNGMGSSVLASISINHTSVASANRKAMPSDFSSSGGSPRGRLAESLAAGAGIDPSTTVAFLTPALPLGAAGGIAAAAAGTLPPSAGSNLGLWRTSTASAAPARLVEAQVAPLVAGLQDRLRQMLSSSTHHQMFNRHDDLTAVRAEYLIAHGGFGSVYQGLWQGLEVAIKVVPQRMDHTDSVREAVELAVMSTISHPNVLQVQNFFTDVKVSVALPGERSRNGLLRLETGLVEDHHADYAHLDSSTGNRSLPSPSRAQQQQGASGGANKPTSEPVRCLVICMELCDQGSLDDAIVRGAFRLASPGKPTRINMLAVLTTLLELAMALRHMHSLQLVHCDVKPGNVLLKSSMSDVRQFTTKLCDFGLVKIRQEANDFTETIRRSTFTGTVTHSPPEMLRGDPHPDFPIDVYAMGILMWELTSSQPVYASLNDRQVAQQVVYNGLRPEFPRGIDTTYKDLAQRCWATDPKERPTSEQLVKAISGMLMGLRERAAAASRGGGGSSSAQAPQPPQQHQQQHHHNQHHQHAQSKAAGVGGTSGGHSLPVGASPCGSPTAGKMGSRGV